jgi:hypothetical protein
MRSKTLVAGLLVLSCASPAAPRLRAIVIDGGDGAVAYTGLFQDTQLDIECRPGRTVAGDWRCLPSSYHLLAYADASCTMQVVVTDEVVEDDWVADQTGRGAGPATVYAIDRDAASTGNWYVDRGSGGCMLVAAGHIAPVHAVAPDAFAPGESVLEPHGEVGAHVFTSDDGAHVVLAAYDVARGWDCDLYWLPGDDRCMPTNVAWRSGRYFGDATCSHAVAYTSPGELPDAILADDGPGIPAFELGPPVAQGFVIDAGVCHAFDDGGHRFYDVGASIPDASLPRAQIVEVGSGRLRARYLAAEGDETPLTARYETFFDRERNAECASTMLHGTSRCVDSTAAYVGTYYADAACTQPLAIGGVDPVRLVGGDPLRAAVGPHAGLIFSDDGTSGCVEATLDTTQIAYDVGAAVPDDTFALLTRRTE